MAMGSSKDGQDELFVPRNVLKMMAGHPFYEALEKLLRKAGFDRHVEGLCSKFYAKTRGRPSLPPGTYFRCLLVGYFEGIDSERGIAWRVGDSLSLRTFLRIPLSASTPDHSTFSRIRQRIDLETHQQVFSFVLKIVAEHGLLKGKSLGVDATTLEANAALRSLVRRDTGQGYTEYLRDMAKASGIQTPSREDLAKLDRKRAKKGSNKDWVNPHEPDSEITKMKTGGTRLAHKHEHAVDMDSGAIVGMSLHGGSKGDTSTVEKTLKDADENLEHVRSEADEDTVKRMSSELKEVTADKGYHSNDVLLLLKDCGLRGYISEPNRGRRKWEGNSDARDAVYLNRQRVKRRKGKHLLKRRGELLERAMAHLFNSGGMRRIHLRSHDNIQKRLLIHAAGFNLSLVMRELFGVGKPRCLQGQPGLLRALLAVFWSLCVGLMNVLMPSGERYRQSKNIPGLGPCIPLVDSANRDLPQKIEILFFSTAC